MKLLTDRVLKRPFDGGGRQPLQGRREASDLQDLRRRHRRRRRERAKGFYI